MRNLEGQELTNMEFQEYVQESIMKLYLKKNFDLGKQLIIYWWL